MELYSKEELLKELKKEYSCGGECDHCPEVLDAGSCSVLRCIRRIIDNAPTVEYPFYAEAYQTGFEEAKVIIIHSIAEQYTAHNELVPIWLSIGDIKGGVEND